MITNVEFNNVRKGSIASYAKYCVSPKEQELANHHPVGDERLEAFYCTNMTTIDAQTSLKDKRTWAKQFETDIRAWNEEHKKGRPLTKRGEKKDKAADFESNQCVLGTISFGVDDKVTKEQAMAFAIESIQNVMPGTRQMMVAIHGDGQVMHAHFIVSVVDLETGKAYAPQGEYRAMYNQWELENERMELHYPDILEHVQQREAVAIQERKAALAQGIEGFESTRTTRVNQLSHGSHQQIFKREMELSEVPEANLRTQFLLACQESNKDFGALLDNLSDRGILVVPNMGTEKVGGLAIAFRDELPDLDGKYKGLLKTTKLSTYGKDYGWKNLSKDFNYDPSKHLDRLVKSRVEANTRAAECLAIANNPDRHLGEINAARTTSTALDRPNEITDRAGQIRPTNIGPAIGHVGAIRGHEDYADRHASRDGKDSIQGRNSAIDSSSPDRGSNGQISPTSGHTGKEQGSLEAGDSGVRVGRSETQRTEDYRRIRPENYLPKSGTGLRANRPNEDPAQTSSGRSGKPDYSVRSDGANSGIDGGMVDNGTGQTTGIDGTEAGRNRKEGGLLVSGVVGHKPEMANTTAKKIADYFKVHPKVREYFANFQKNKWLRDRVEAWLVDGGWVRPKSDHLGLKYLEGKEPVTVEDYVEHDPLGNKHFHGVQRSATDLHKIESGEVTGMEAELQMVDRTQDDYTETTEQREAYEKRQAERKSQEFIRA